jgi:hypothetical protein
MKLSSSVQMRIMLFNISWPCQVVLKRRALRAALVSPQIHSRKIVNRKNSAMHIADFANKGMKGASFLNSRNGFVCEVCNMHCGILSVHNLSRMEHIIIVDLDNWGCFFNKLPSGYLLPPHLNSSK